MKKVKTFLASIMIILATAVCTACSCSGDDGVDNTPQVPVSGITITSDFDRATRDDETGYLNITCNQNDKFNITYSLAPDNTTRTQVDWDFEGDDSIVVVEKNYYSYSQGATHTVSFKANKEGNTIIKFKPKNTDKWTQATVYVGKAKSVLPSFVAPTGLKYNPTTGKVTWKAVTKMKLYTGEEVNVSTNNGVVNGLTGYIVSYKNLTTGEEYTTPYNTPITACEYELPRGYTYQINVYARGDDEFTMKDSPVSATFKFHQLATVTDISNNNGEISFTSQDYSEQHQIYYLGSQSSKYITQITDGKETVKFIAGEKFDNAEQYKISVVSYPENYANATTEDGISYVYNESSGIRYYASVRSEETIVENLVAPTISISAKRGITTVGGVDFGKEGSDNNPYLGSILSWKILNKTYGSEHLIKYAYTISKNTEGNKWEKISPTTSDFAIGTSFDLSQLTASNDRYKITVYAYGNPQTTIASKTVDFFFNIQTPMNSDTSNTTTTIDNTTLTTSEANSNLYGVDLYFVNRYDSSKSVHKFFSGKSENGGYNQKQMSIDIAGLNLTAGEYDIYGRFVGINEGTQNISATSIVAKINNNPVKVASAVKNSDIAMSSAGKLTFKPVDGISKYQINISQKAIGSSTTDTFKKEVIDNSSEEDPLVRVDVYALIKAHLLTKDGITSDNLEEEFSKYTSNANITLTITSIGVDGEGINSSPSSKLQFKRYNVVDANTIKLSYNKLSFTSSNDSATYIVEINGKKFQTDTYNEGVVVEIDLTNEVTDYDTINNETSSTIKPIDCVNKSSKTTIKIWALGAGAKANDSGTGFVDSYATSKEFDCSSTIQAGTIEMELSNLKWNLEGEFGDTQKFSLKAYTKVGEGWQIVDGYERLIEATKEAESSEGESEEGIESLATTDRKYTYNIGDWISGLDTNKTIAITITHVVEDRFTNVESDKYYIIQLPQVEVSRKLDNSTPSISFKAEAGVSYQLNVTNKSDNSSVKDVTYYGEATTDKIIHLSDLDLNSVGSYKISIYAYKNNGENNAESNPYALSGIPGTVDIDIVSREITAKANGQNITWNNINNAVTYQVEYKTPSGEYVYIQEEEENKVFTDTLTYNVWTLFEAGENTVKIIPAVDYVQDGVYLIGSVLETPINKLHTIASSSITNGVIKYTLSESDTFTNNNYSIAIKIGSSQLLAGEYSIDYSNNTIAITSSKYIGEKNYNIQIIADGQISSDYSSNITAIKVSRIEDIGKKDDYIMFTPVTGANIYILTFEDTNGDTTTKTIKYDVGNSKIYSKTDSVESDEGEWQEIVDEEIAKYYDRKIYLNFYAEMFGLDISNGGIYYYSVTPNTKITGYLNGNISDKYKLAKLSQEVNIAIEEESFVVSNYIRTTDELQTPERISYAIQYSQDVVLDNAKNGDWEDISWEFDPDKFDTDCQVSYQVTFYTTGENGENTKEYSQIYLFDSKTHTIQVLAKGDGETTQDEYVNKAYLSVSSSGNKYIITLSKDQIASTEVKNALGSSEDPILPDRVKIEYIESKIVYKNEVLFSSVNIEGEGENGANSWEINLNTLGINATGNYTLHLQFIGNDNEIISSDIVSSEIFNKLETASLQTVDGVLSWTSTGASTYTLKITCDPLGIETGGDEEDGESAEICEWTFDNYSPSEESVMFNISEEQLKSFEGTNFVGFETGRNYYIQIRANADDKLSSKWSDIFTVQKLQAPTNIQIKSTSNSITSNGQTYYIGEPQVTWEDPNSISNNPNYTLWIGDRKIDINNTGAVAGQLIPSDLISKKYEISMCTIGNTTTGTNKIGLLTSDRSTQNPQANYVTETTDVYYKDNAIKWDTVTGAYTYKLTFYKGSFSQSDMFDDAEKVFTAFTNTNSYNFSATEFDGVGYYTVLINAYCDPSKAIVSTYTNLEESGEPEVYDVSNCTSLYKSPAISRLMVKDGLLSWSLEMTDIQEFLAVHTNAGDKLVEYFAGEITSTNPATRKEQLVKAVVGYISGKINSNKTGDESVDAILSNLYTFNAIINGKSATITPSSVDTIKISGTTTEPVYTSVANPNEAQYLMFKYDFTNNPTETSTSKFVIQVAPKGNYKDSNSNGLITTVDGKFTTSITAYKPKTPTSVNIDSGEDGTRKQISDGNIYWSLVTNEDSTLGEFKYHNKYKLSAIRQDSIDISPVSKEIDINSTIVEEGGVETNPNLEDNINYHLNLKDLYKNDVDVNTSYIMQLSVMGTKDSTTLTSDEKIYFNSNIFEYTDIMNILANYGSSVSNGVYSYIPCANISTQTKVVVYGPFLDDSDNIIYAPDQNDKSTWVWKDVAVEGHSFTYDYSEHTGEDGYNKALTAWKTIIAPIWESAVNNETGKWLGKYGKLRNEYIFKEEASSDEISSVISRTTTLNLTGNQDNKNEDFYGAGSYIIRKQEIGNGRGIIDTEYTENIKDGEGNILNLEYEEVATKLDKTTKSIVIDIATTETKENDIWLDKGRFAWKKVPRANAYRLIVQKLKSAEDGSYTEAGSYTETIMSTSKDDNEYFDMPENSIYNESGYVYRITITATHLESDKKTITPNYFEGENVTTDAYGRAPIPDNLKIDELGNISWNEDSSYDAIESFEIKVNENSSSTQIIDQTQDKTYNLSSVPFGTFEFSIRAKGKTDGTASYLNSCYNPTITITKLTDPIIDIVNGQVKWGTDTSAGMGEQQTKTDFTLQEKGEAGYKVNTTLDETQGSYILHTEITEFGNTSYNPAEEEYTANTEYTFGVKYEGTPSTIIKNDDTNRQIIIASDEKTISAKKLGYPTLSSVDVFKDSLSENRIRWNAIDNASGYRALVITQRNKKDVIFDITETFTETQEATEKITTYKTDIVIYENGVKINDIHLSRTNSTKDENYYFEYNNTEKTIDLRLAMVIDQLSLSSENGLALDVYVQAIGTLQASSVSTGTKYINSSFSARKKIEIPPMPTGIAFESSTGTLSWDTDTSAGHNARITMEYTVNNVTSDDFNNYWEKTADVIKLKGSESGTTADNKDNRYDEIKSRTVEYEIISNDTSTTYKLTVVDTVLVSAQNGQTPTSYQVTNIGTNYSFRVRILVGDESYQGAYMSKEAVLSSSDTPINFQAFEYGDGSIMLPYGVKNSTMFNSIRHYPNANFVIIDDIAFEENAETNTNWETIETFTGSIDGGNHKVEYLRPSYISISNDYGDTTIYKALIKDNKGTIKNLTLSVNNSLDDTITNSTVYLSGLAITNSGTIDNVHITTFGSASLHISAKVIGSTSATKVAGLVNENSGTISNSSVETTTTITALDDNAKTYKISTLVAGLVNINSGTIDNSYFSGNLQGNFVGGIANENSGTISNSYSLGKAFVTDTGVTIKDGKYTVDGKGTSYGGIAGTIYGNANIINCYSRMTLQVNIKSTSEITLKAGGLVGTIDSNKTGYTNNITIKNSYVVFEATHIGETSKVNNMVYVVAPYLSDVTYENNYYISVNVTGANNISSSTTDSVASSSNDLETLCSNMLAIEGSIYSRPTVSTASGEVISKYPLLSSNVEKNIITVAITE